MEGKRPYNDLDPDYEDIGDQQNKRQRLLEHDAKLETTKKIEDIIRQQFAQELKYKETEVDIIDQRLHKARQKLDGMRASLVASYYSTATQAALQQKSGQDRIVGFHPELKRTLGKAPLGVATGSDIVRHGDLPMPPPSATSARALPGIREEKGDDVADTTEHGDSAGPNSESIPPKVTLSRSCGSRGHFKEKKRVIVGNVSRYILTEKRDAGDRATHKWMVYVRGPKDRPNISSFVKKVWFFLHPSYSPNDLVELSQEPFHLIRRGWGEFPVRVQLHFVDPRNKRVDLIHHLKLDKTYTGLQTLGAETVVDLEIEGNSDYPNHGSFPSSGIGHTAGAPPVATEGTNEEVRPSSCDSTKDSNVIVKDLSSHSDEAWCVVDSPLGPVMSQSTVGPVSLPSTLGPGTLPPDLYHQIKPTSLLDSSKRISSSQIVAKSDRLSPVKSETQCNGFIARPSHDDSIAPRDIEKTLNVSPCVRVEPDNTTTCHVKANHETTVTSSSGGTLLHDFHANSDITDVQTIAVEDGGLAFSSSRQSPNGTHSSSPQTTGSDAPSVSPMIIDDAGTDCPPPCQTPTVVSSYHSPASDSPLRVPDTQPGRHHTYILVRPGKDGHTSTVLSHNASATLSQNASGTPGQSLLRPKLLTCRTASSDHQFVRVVDRLGRAYMVPRSAAQSGIIRTPNKASAANTVVVVTKPAINAPNLNASKTLHRLSGSFAGLGPRQSADPTDVPETPKSTGLDNSAAGSMISSVLPSGVSLLDAQQRHSNSLLKSSIVGNKSFGTVSLLKSNNPTAAGVQARTVVPSSATAASGAASAAKTLTMPHGHVNRTPMPVATPSGSTTAPREKLFLAKLGNRTVMIRVEPKADATTDTPGTLEGLGTEQNKVLPESSKSILGKTPRAVKEVVGDISFKDPVPSTSDRIANFAESISLDDYGCLEELVREAMRHFPLWRRPVAAAPQSTEYSPCTDILQWHVGKQRAAEWLHSRLIRRAVSAALDGRAEFKLEKAWTTRKVMMWCRYHGYTPLDMATQRTLQRVSHRNVGPRKFDSYTDCKDLLPLIEGTTSSACIDEPDVDVDTVELNTNKSACIIPHPTTVVSSEMVAPSAEVEFIQKVAQQIDVHFGPVPLSSEPDDCMYSGVTEILMWTWAMTFAERLLRAAVCSYHKRELLDNDEVTPVDVYDAVSRTECFDFLTNRFMGVKLEDQPLSQTRVVS